MADPHASVVVLGGGPSGAITAFLLARAGIDVWVFDRRSARHGERGEVLAPEARPALARLGLWDRRPSETFSRCESSRVAWRSSTLVERGSITNPYGCGWRICRPELDDWLLQEAAIGGARVFTNTVASRIERENGTWRLLVQGAFSAPVTACVLVDATGRSLARQHWSGTARSRLDGLCVLLGRGRREGEWSDLLVEACPDGWCYSIGVATEAVVGYVTDADVLAAKGRGRAGLESALSASPLNAARVRELTNAVTTVSAATTSLEQGGGDGWLAVGDAALAHDPLAGQGLLFALQSAQDAARAVEGHLGGDAQALPRYATTMRAWTVAYLLDRRAVYAAQPRWNDRPFWRRRSGAAAIGAG